MPTVSSQNTSGSTLCFAAQTGVGRQSVVMSNCPSPMATNSGGMKLPELTGAGDLRFADGSCLTAVGGGALTREPCQSLSGGVPARGGQVRMEGCRRVCLRLTE